jgi:hypothetical protein
MRILIIIFLIYLAFQVIFRFVLPLILRYFFQKAAQNMNGQFGQNQQQSPPLRRQGEVRIEEPGNAAPHKKHFSSGDVEDVDYVEVK